MERRGIALGVQGRQLHTGAPSCDLHMYGPDGIQFYTRTKVVTERWPDPASSKVDLGFPRTR
jgi:hypothetical protein